MDHLAVSTLLLATLADPAPPVTLPRLTEAIADAVRQGRPTTENTTTFCTRLKGLSEQAGKFAGSPDPAFQLARSALTRLRKRSGCPLRGSKGGPTLWQQFKAAKAARQTARDPQQAAQYQSALSTAAILLLNEIGPDDDRFRELLSSLSLHVLSEDAAAALRQIAGALPESELTGERGKHVAEAVTTLLRKLPPASLRKEDLDAILSFSTKVARANPDWLRTPDAAELVGIVIGALERLPPNALDQKRLGVMVDFVTRVIAEDPRWLDGDRGLAVMQFLPRLLGRMDVTKVQRGDLEALLSFSARVVASDARWPSNLRTMAEHWGAILQIVSAAGNKETQKVLVQAINDVCALDGTCSALTQEVSKDRPDPGVVLNVLKTLGQARVQRIRLQQAALQGRPVAVAQDLVLRVLVGLQLPAPCKDTERDDRSCANVFAFADQFRSAIVGGGPEKGDVSGAFSGPLQTMLSDAECTLLQKTVTSRGEACEPKKEVVNTFASFVALEVQAPSADGTFLARTGCVVVSETEVVDRVEVVASERFAVAPSAASATTAAAQRLAERALDRCPLSRPHSDYAAYLMTRGRVSQRASDALLFAGLPYLKDLRETDGPSRSLAWSLGILDASTLGLGAGSLAGAVYVNNSSGSPWDVRLLRAGIVLVASNLALKAGSAWLYHSVYGGGR